MPRRIAKWLTPTRHENASDSRWFKRRREEVELTEARKDATVAEAEAALERTMRPREASARTNVHEYGGANLPTAQERAEVLSRAIDTKEGKP